MGEAIKALISPKFIDSAELNHWEYKDNIITVDKAYYVFENTIIN